MLNATLPGDWTVRGSVIVDRSEECLPNATRIEILRAVAGMIRRGQCVTVLAHQDPTGKASAKWTRIVGEHINGADRAFCRAIARNALRAFV